MVAQSSETSGGELDVQQLSPTDNIFSSHSFDALSHRPRNGRSNFRPESDIQCCCARSDIFFDDITDCAFADTAFSPKKYQLDTSSINDTATIDMEGAKYTEGFE